MLRGKDRGDVQWAKYNSPYSSLSKFITKTFDTLAKVLEDECGTIAFLGSKTESLNAGGSDKGGIFSESAMSLSNLQKKYSEVHY